MWIKFVKILNSFAFIFAAISWVFALIGVGQPDSLIFLWAVVLTCAACYLRTKSKKLSWAVLLCIIIPVFFNIGTDSISYIVISAVFAAYIIYKNIYSIGYEDFADEFKIIIRFIFFILFSSLILRGAFKIREETAAYMIIYVITSVLLLRILRVKKYNVNNKNAEKLNSIYTIIFTGAAFALSQRVIRNFIFYYLKTGLNFVLDLIGKALFYILIPIGYLVGFLSKYFKGFELKSNIKVNNAEPSGSGSINYKDPAWAKSVLQSKSFEVIMRILVIAIVMVIIFLILKKVSHSSEKEETFEEVKESIIFENKKRKDKKSPLQGIFKPQDTADAIRWYYIKFLKLCRKHNINYGNSDTSFDINKHACTVYDKNILDKFREIYIKARYGKDLCSSEDEKTAEKLYRDIKK